MNNVSSLQIRHLFLKSLAIIYLIAFISIWVQINGLIGENGILPSSQYLELIRSKIGIERYLLFPTLCWLNPSDAFLNILCCGGVIFSIFLFFNLLPPLFLFLLWFIYLSISIVCQDFMYFQWDILLLEVGFLSIFYALFLDSIIFLWLLRLLLFKLVFFSGAVKLLSGDVSWHNLTALTYHYETQPLPHIISYYFHWLPLCFHKSSCFLMFVIELVVPFLIFTTKKLRKVAALFLISFQLLIIFTGNYCFFNLLTIALCLLLFNDDSKNNVLFDMKSSFKWVVIPITIIILIVNTMLFFRILHIRINWPTPFKVIYSLVSPFRSINSYGLFAVMTTSRPEIIIEGSNDGINWLPYEFKFKPGDLKVPPKVVAPHQPRLDWQMWFSALGSYQSDPWFVNLCVRLLQGSDDAIRLLGKNPFSEVPPRYVRALLYDYHFTTLNEKQKTGNWWKRELKGMYFPAVSLEDGKLKMLLN